MFGSGGGLLQDCTRDTLRYALKCCWVRIDGKERNVSKEPVTDISKDFKGWQIEAGEKPVHLGLAMLMYGMRVKTVPANEPGDDLLIEVFRDGAVLSNPSLEDIRKRAELR